MHNIHKTTLKSGLKIITEEMPGAESSSIGVWVMAGSRDEGEKVAGISHFIEHMLFKGTSRRTALDISMEIESVGGVLNAFTGREYTCFYAKVLNKDMPGAIDLLSDIFINSRFDRTELLKEKMVVLQEIKLVEDTPDDLIHDLFAERFWKGQPLGRPVLGSAGTVKSLGRDDVVEYYREHYRSNGVFITVAGGVRHSTVARLLKGAFDGVRQGRTEKAAVRAESVPGAYIVKKRLEQAHLCVGVPVPPQAHADRYKTYLLNTILGGGMSSRLFQEIREKRGLAYSVYSYLNLCKDAGALTIYAGTSAKGFKETVRLIMAEFAKLRRDGVGRRELANAKSQLKGSMLLGLETSDSRMTKLARDEIYFGEVVPVREIVKGIDGVSARDIKRLASEVLSPGMVTLVAMGSVSEKDLPQGLRRLA